MSWSEVQGKFNKFSLRTFGPYILKEESLKESVKPYIGLAAILDGSEIHGEEIDVGSDVVMANTVLVVVNSLATTAQTATLFATLFASGQALSTAVNVTTLISSYVGPPAMLLNALVEGVRGVTAANRSLAITRLLRQSQWPCNCHRLGALSTNPATGKMRGVRYNLLGMDSRETRSCGALANYATSQLDKRSDRARTASSLLAPMETMRSLGRTMQKRWSGTRGQQRRLAAINLWGAARQADTVGEGYVGHWHGDGPRLTLDGERLTLSDGDIIINRLAPVGAWSDISSNGCPLAVGMVHGLLGGSIGSISSSEWRKTLSTIGAFDGWRVIEEALRSV